MIWKLITENGLPYLVLKFSNPDFQIRLSESDWKNIVSSNSPFTIIETINNTCKLYLYDNVGELSKQDYNFINSAFNNN